MGRRNRERIARIEAGLEKPIATEKIVSLSKSDILNLRVNKGNRLSLLSAVALMAATGATQDKK